MERFDGEERQEYKKTATGALRSLPPAGYGCRMEVMVFLKSIVKRHRLLLIAVFLGVSTSLLSLSVLSAYVKTKPVVAAARDMDPYHRISLDDIKVIEMPLKAILPSSITRVEEVLGAYTLSKVCQGQVLLEGHVVRGREGAGISFELSPEERAIFIPATAARAVGGFIKKGDRVDVLWAGRGYGLDDRGGPGVAATVLKSARVIEILRDQQSGEFMGVVITATPDSSEVIARYLENGAIYLALVPRAASFEEGGGSEVWPQR
ncbi:MAG: Flp pilus assembly protein CpaB [Candidatus Fermentithermobacillus carboniphilus]|uniref:Flp pilus assembly protein CpaB n=1 Tax=Candidatus Fermentithermobacillus carboniphilus TaxID=3085328 RepID=A0AAT9LBA6_9FIRM|nr:MAG: Flp pilus assembly protein CpaB [Candidatus Fermentithermobacillus carboniphilus]